MNQNEGTLIISCWANWIVPCTIPKLIPGVRVHLVIDLPNTRPRSDVNINVFCSIEPPSTRPDVHAKLSDRDWCSQWDIIAGANPGAIALSERAKRYVHTPFWIDPYNGTKVFGVSTIMSPNRATDGHKLRHWFRENWKIKIPSKIFYRKHPTTRPDDIWQPYPVDRRDCFRMMFHLCIENCRSPGYFTEKLMDCFRSRSVPIYWGDPNIGEVFDTSGMILIHGMCGPEMRYIISNLTPEDYEKRREAVERNAAKAEEYCEGHNPYPYDKSIPPAMCKRLGLLLREAQQNFIDKH